MGTTNMGTTTNPYSNLDEEYLEQARNMRPVRKQQKRLKNRHMLCLKICLAAA